MKTKILFIFYFILQASCTSFNDSKISIDRKTRGSDDDLFDVN